jgi:FAD/FMN-containing dehydrogenase
MELFLEAEKNSPELPTAPFHGKFPADCWHLCVSVEGTAEVCDRSSREFAQLAALPTAKTMHLATLGENDGADLWHYLGQAVPLLLEASSSVAIFKIALLPSRMTLLLPQLLALADQASLSHATLARSCGVIYFALLPPTDDLASLERLTAAASSTFALCAKESASATLPWCPTALKRRINIWGPPRPALALQLRLKSAFDPQDLFAPGRLFPPH